MLQAAQWSGETRRMRSDASAPAARVDDAERPRYRTPGLEETIITEIRAGHSFYEDGNLSRLLAFDPSTRRRVLDLIVDLLEYRERQRARLDDVLRTRLDRLLGSIRLTPGGAPGAEGALTYAEVFHRCGAPGRAALLTLLADSARPGALDECGADLSARCPAELIAVARQLAASRPALAARLEPHLVSSYLGAAKGRFRWLTCASQATELAAFRPLTQARILTALRRAGDARARHNLARAGAAFWRAVLGDAHAAEAEQLEWLDAMGPAARGELRRDLVLIARLAPAALLTLFADDLVGYFEALGCGLGEAAFFQQCWRVLGGRGAALPLPDARRLATAFLAVARRRREQGIDVHPTENGFAWFTPAEQYELLVLSRSAACPQLLAAVVRHAAALEDLRLAEFVRRENIVALFGALRFEERVLARACAELDALARRAPAAYLPVMQAVLTDNPRLRSFFDLRDEAPRTPLHPTVAATPAPSRGGSPLEVCLSLLVRGQGTLSESDARAVLGLGHRYDAGQIATAFRARLRMVHPDLFVAHGAEVEALFKGAAQLTILAREILLGQLATQQAA
jgi:hypothetical protein